jgi:hypothetical protein
MKWTSSIQFQNNINIYKMGKTKRMKARKTKRIRKTKGVRKTKSQRKTRRTLKQRGGEKSIHDIVRDVKELSQEKFEKKYKGDKLFEIFQSKYPNNGIAVGRLPADVTLLKTLFHAKEGKTDDYLRNLLDVLENIKVFVDFYHENIMKFGVSKDPWRRNDQESMYNISVNVAFYVEKLKVQLGIPVEKPFFTKPVEEAPVSVLEDAPVSVLEDAPVTRQNVEDAPVEDAPVEDAPRSVLAEPVSDLAGTDNEE